MEREKQLEEELLHLNTALLLPHSHYIPNCPIGGNVLSRNEHSDDDDDDDFYGR